MDISSQLCAAVLLTLGDRLGDGVSTRLIDLEQIIQIEGMLNERTAGGDSGDIRTRPGSVPPLTRPDASRRRAFLFGCSSLRLEPSGFVDRGSLIGGDAGHELVDRN